MNCVGQCYHALQKEEGRTARRYGAVLRVRPDHVFLRPLPPVTAEGGWLGTLLVPGRVLLWDDQFAVARREDAPAVLLAPSLAYGACADEAQWVRAAAAQGAPAPADWTMGRCRDDTFQPCPTTALAAIAFGAATAWRELRLEPRAWLPGVGPARPATEHFCLQRARPRANETRAHGTSAPSGRFFDGVGMSC